MAPIVYGCSHIHFQRPFPLHTPTPHAPRTTPSPVFLSSLARVYTLTEYTQEVTQRGAHHMYVLDVHEGKARVEVLPRVLVALSLDLVET